MRASSIFKRWATILLFVPSIAVAQTPAPSPTAAKEPNAPRFENDCTHFYPPAAAETGAEGRTVVSVHVMPDGAVRSPQVAETSGNADLDKAAVACVTGAHIPPIKKGGMPIEADSQLHVVWQRSYFSGAPIAKSQNMCRTVYYPPIAMRLGHEGDTLLSFTIAEDGTLKNVKIAESSGYDELDQASIACVADFQFRPVTQNGRPVAVDGKTEIKWRLH